tara:strand:- start:56 stop:1126 length:1071 start_codon:yes stop_codon:yes gene_type:complete
MDGEGEATDKGGNARVVGGWQQGDKGTRGPPNLWDIRKVTDMSELFNRQELKEFNDPIGDWDMRNVVNMEGMFRFAKSFNQPIGQWQTENVSNMARMFYEASSFNQPIGQWQTENAAKDGMFLDAKAMEEKNKPGYLQQINDLVEVGIQIYVEAAARLEVLMSEELLQAIRNNINSFIVQLGFTQMKSAVTNSKTRFLTVTKDEFLTMLETEKVHNNTTVDAAKSASEQANHQRYLAQDAAYKTVVSTAQQGDPDPAFKLARKYEDGRGVKKSYSKALNLYQVAANSSNTKKTANHHHAMFSLGFMYIHGNGVDKSRAKAREWWTKGAQLGNPDCQRDLAKFNLNNGKSEGEEKLE